MALLPLHAAGVQPEALLNQARHEPAGIAFVSMMDAISAVDPALRGQMLRGFCSVLCEGLVHTAR